MLIHPTSYHTKMICTNAYCTARWLKCILEYINYLRREIFLHLGPLGQYLNKPTYFAEPYNPPIRDISEMGLSHDWLKVMRAAAHKRHDFMDHLIVATFCKFCGQASRSINCATSKILRECSDYALRGILHVCRTY